MDISHFLRSFINKTENNKLLINMLLKRINYKFGALFWRKNNNTYEILEHVYISETESKYSVSFTPKDSIKNIFISRDGKELGGYKAPYLISNIINIPINVCNDIIGILCIGNKNSNPKEEDIKKIEDLISLTQLIVNKCKLIGDYKKIYSDSTYISKDLFLANMSHEIRTPLNGIIGYNQLLANTELNKTQKTYLSSVSKCSIQLMQIINDIIDFSKLSSGNMKTNNECFSVNEILHNIYETMKESINIKKHTCVFTVDETVPPYIILDKQKLIQIIINLLSNSINYTPFGGKIEVFVSNNNEELYVSVQDNGIGVSLQDQCKLFNSFMQLHNSASKNGTGLGLAISKRLVELLKGEINVQSSPGIGSKFYFTAKHKKIEEVENSIKTDSKILKHKFVLVVDDNLDNRIFLGDILFEWGMKPIICASAREAVQIISACRYDFELGMIDICMPDINGIELAEQIKKIKPLFPLIALSSISDFVNTTNFDDKLNKPINKLQLFNSVHKIVSQNIKDSAFIGSEENTNIENDSVTSTTNSPKESFKKDSKILIAEDILYNQTLLENMLKILGYNNIVLASDGEEAIEKLDDAFEQKEPFSIILLDLRMPKMDGYDVINHIRKKGYPLPKIVAVTASVLQEIRQRCKNMGVQYFINKPIDMNQLKKVMLRVCHRICLHKPK